MIARWVRSPSCCTPARATGWYGCLMGGPLYAFTDKGRKAYYASKAHSEATRGDYRKAEPEPRSPHPPLPKDTPFGTLTRQIAKVMGGYSKRREACEAGAHCAGSHRADKHSGGTRYSRKVPRDGIRQKTCGSTTAETTGRVVRECHRHDRTRSESCPCCHATKLCDSAGRRRICC